ncbi:protein kinase [Polyangium aurulentum]|nr:protein kinase [Polyangium aurulentum]
MSGVVYAARRSPEGDRVALKVIRQHLLGDPHFAPRFEREAKILKRLEGNHIVRVLDVVEDDGLLALVLEYVEGQSLEAVLRERLPEPNEAVEIMLQVCAALGAAHAGGFVHRDLKPANVIIQGAIDDGSGPMVSVVDFGLAKALDTEPSEGTSLTERNMILGTPEYMAPEQVRGEPVDRRCDIYAAGVMLFEMLTGRVPFSGRTPIASMTAHLTEPVPSARAARPDRGISPALDAVVMRALAKSPDDRYPTSRALAEALSAARDPHLVIAPQAIVDADALATGDTELELKAVVQTLPMVPAPAPPSKTLADPVPAAVARPGQPPRWVWVVVAVIFAALAVAVGAIVGAR